MSAQDRNNCQNVIPLSCGDCIIGDTLESTNDHDCDPGHDGPDNVYVLELPADAQVQFIGEADYDADWTITTTCEENSGNLLCVDSSGTHVDPECGSITHNNWSVLNYTVNLSTGPYFIWVDSYYSGSGGNYALQIICADQPTATPTPTLPPTYTPTPTFTPTNTYTPTPRPGNDCSDTIIISCGSCVVGNTNSLGNNHDCGTGHEGLDIVYQFEIPEPLQVQFIGEADYDADWSIATSCSYEAGDILCVDQFGIQMDPSCSDLVHNNYGFMNDTVILNAGVYFIWIDGYYSGGAGNYALEILCSAVPTNTPTPTATPTNTPTYVPAQIYVQETILLSDWPNIYPPAEINVTESISVADPDAVVPPAEIAVVESISIIDVDAVVPPAIISVVESISVADPDAIVPPAEIAVVESISIVDVDAVVPPAIISVVESISVADPDAVVPPAVIHVTEALNASDLIYIPTTPTVTPTPTPMPTNSPIPTDTPEPTPTPDCIHHGDVDFNSRHTAGDSQLAFYIAVGMYSPTYLEECAADCNGDDHVTAGDAQDIFGAIFGGSCVDPIPSPLRILDQTGRFLTPLDSEHVEAERITLDKKAEELQREFHLETSEDEKPLTQRR